MNSLYKNELIWVTARNADGSLNYMITSTQARDMYFLYTPTPDGGWKRWGKHPSAGVLRDRFEEKRR